MGIFTQSSNRRIRKISQALVLMTGLMFGTVAVNAQTEMLWTGASSDNFIIDENWDPAGSPIGNILTIPMPDTTEATGTPDAQPHAVVVTGAENITVAALNIAYASDDAYQSTVTINLDNNDVTFDDTDRSSHYNWTGIILEQGHYIYDTGNGPRLDSDNAKLIVKGGVAEFFNLLMGNANTPSRGGKVYISGDGYVKLNDTFGRMYTAKEGGQVEIIENGTLEINGNFTAPTADWINGGADYTIARTYDAINNKTYYTAKPSTFIGIENSDRQVLKNGEETSDTLRLLGTAAVESATTFQWRYRVVDGTDYTNFDNSNAAKFAPSFASSGTFLVSCLVDGVATENEVEFFVVSNAISFLPAEFPIQFLRIGEEGTEMTAEFTSTPTSIEWKYSLTPGGPYVSFEPAGTEATFKPSFTDSVANHYVVVEATIDGNTHSSVELLYTVEAVSSISKSITWTGLISDKGTDPGNWNPVANPYKNSIAVGVLDTIDGVPPTYPLYQPEGNDTIYTFWVGPGATMTVDMADDTLNLRGGWQQAQGELILENCVLVNAGFFRLDRATGIVRVKNNSQMIIESLLMGDRTTNGGVIYLTDNAKLRCINVPGRVAPDTLQSVTYVSDNAEIIYTGDQRPTVETWISTGKIICPQEGYEPVVLYDNVNDLTYLKARNTMAFSIADDSRTFTTAGNEISTAITLTNVEGVTGFEWKYATNVFGPWESFDPVATDPNFTPSFSAPGDYYVVAETTDGVITSNMKLVTVVDLTVTPSAYQQLDTNVDGETLYVNVVLGADLTLLSGEWFIYDDATGLDESTSVTDTLYVPQFFFDGKYEVYYYAIVQDADGNSYDLLSNTVKFYVNVEPDAATEIRNSNFELYPNPAKEAFYVNEASNSYSISLIDAQGRVVLKKAFNDVYGAQRVDFNEAGMYVVKVETDSVVKTKRIVIE